MPSKEETDLLFRGARDIDIVFIGTKNNRRKHRLEKLTSSFPQATCYGKGWEKGYVDDSILKDIYRRAKIGWNIHNSTGPINRRLFALGGPQYHAGF